MRCGSERPSPCQGDRPGPPRAALASCSGEPLRDTVAIRAARLWLGSANAPPADDDPRWEPVALPDSWGLARRRDAVTGWYRCELQLSRAPDELWAVYLPWVSTSLEIYVNGQLVGDTGQHGAAVIRSRRPALLPVPPLAVHAGRKTIDFRMRVNRGWPAVFTGFEVGPAAALEPIFARRYFFRVTLLEAFAAAGLLLAALIAWLYLRRERRTRNDDPVLAPAFERTSRDLTPDAGGSARRYSFSLTSPSCSASYTASLRECTSSLR